MKRYIKSLFYSKNKPQPAYLWVSLLMPGVVTIFYYKIWWYISKGLDIPVPFITTILGFVGGWIVVYKWREKINGNTEKD